MNNSKMVRFLMWLTAWLPCRCIDGDNGEPYLERYFLFRVFGFCAYIHRFRASDPDRGLHDHPWPYAISWVLAGGYDEVRMSRDPRAKHGTIVRPVKPGALNLLRGDDFHRVLMNDAGEAWTLFMHMPRRKGWGFLENNRYRAFALTSHDYPLDKWWQRVPSGRVVREARA